MSIRFFVTIFSVIFISVCCNYSKSQERASVLISYPHEQTALIGDFDSYIDSIQTIALETTDESLITHIEKILLTSDKRLVILNSTGILLFDSNGNFLFRIGKIGRAPGEYQKIYDMCLDGKFLFAVDYNNNVLKYSLDNGQFIQQITPLFPEKYPTCIGIAPATEGGFFLFGCNPFNDSDFEHDFYCLNQFDKNGNHIAHFLLREDYVIVSRIITQSYDNSYLIRPQTGDNICYRIKNGEVYPFVKIDFKEKGIPCRYIKFETDGGFDLQRFIYAPYYKLPIYFQETQNQFYFSCAAPEDANNLFFLVNKKTLSGISWKVIGLSNPNLVIGYASDEDYFYYVFHDYNEYDKANLPNDMDLLKKYLITRKDIKLGNEDSNPLIVKVKFNI